MRFDPVSRLEKYRAVMSSLTRHGFTTVAPTDSRRIDCLHISHPERPDFDLSFTCRKRGWQIHFPRRGKVMGSVFELPNRDIVPNLVRSLLQSVHALKDQPSIAITLAFGLRHISYAQWLEDNRKEDAERWQLFGWQELSEEEVQEIERRYTPFFFPGGDLKLPSPSQSWQINELFRLSHEQWENIAGRLMMRALRSFQAAARQDEEIFVVDWQHACYRLNVRKGIRRPYRDEWARLFIERGDDVECLAPDFRFGLFALRDGGLHVFGARFLEAFLRYCPLEKILSDVTKRLR